LSSGNGFILFIIKSQPEGTFFALFLGTKEAENHQKDFKKPKIIHPTSESAVPTRGIGSTVPSCDGQKSNALRGVPSGGQFVGLGPQAATHPGLSLKNPKKFQINPQTYINIQIIA